MSGFSFLENGRPKTDIVDDFGLKARLGLIPGAIVLSKFARTNDFNPADTPMTIWEINNQLYQFSATANITQFSSSNVSDTQNILVEGLDANYDLIQEVITLTGQAVVNSSQSFLRVFRMTNIGSVDIAGTVYCSVSGSALTAGVPNDTANIRAVIQDGNNQTQLGTYTIPNGYVGFLYNTHTIGGRNGTNGLIEVSLRVRPQGGVFLNKGAINLNMAGSSMFQDSSPLRLAFPPKADIDARIDLATDSDNQVSVFYTLLLIPVEQLPSNYLATIGL